MILNWIWRKKKNQKKKRKKNKVTDEKEDLTLVGFTYVESHGCIQIYERSIGKGITVKRAKCIAISNVNGEQTVCGRIFSKVRGCAKHASAMHVDQFQSINEKRKSQSTKWVQCDSCKKWRRLSKHEKVPDQWMCIMNNDETHNSCEDPQEMEDWEIDQELGLSPPSSPEHNLGEDKSDFEDAVITSPTVEKPPSAKLIPIEPKVTELQNNISHDLSQAVTQAVAKPVIGFSSEPIQLLPHQVRNKVQKDFDSLYEKLFNQ